MGFASRKRSKRPTKTRKQHGGVSDNIKQLLSSNIRSMQANTQTNIATIKKVMRRYIASPWDAIDKQIMNTDQYSKYLREYKAMKGNNFDRRALCQSRINSSNASYPYQMRLCQSHSGNLFEHSQWSALQIIKWFNENDPIVNNVHMKTAIVAAFFHDIGKGGDCVKTCGELCWYDMYAKDKYNGKGNAVHPSYSGDMILGLKPFRINCEEGCTEDCTINIKTVLEKTFPDVKTAEVALAAEMHWEFGKLNIPGKEESEKIDIYLRNFNLSCQKCNLIPSEPLLRLCMAVACADITAGTNRRLSPNVNGIVPAPERFIGKDPWVIFGMESKYLEYQEKVLATYNKA